MTRLLFAFILATALCFGQVTTPPGGGGSGNATSIQGRSVDPTPPSDQQVMCWSQSMTHWGPCNNAAGFSDPTTTRGDIIYHAASGTARMGLGITNYVLISNGTDLVYGQLVIGSFSTGVLSGTGGKLCSTTGTLTSGRIVSIDAAGNCIDSGVLASAIPAPSSTIPLVAGTGAVGVSTTFARADHVHPGDTTKVSSGVDINGSNQVTATHLAAALPVLQGGTGITAGAVGKVLGGATPSLVTVTSAYVDTSIALTGTDINTSNQVTATHLAAPLPVSQGGTGTTTPGIVAGTNVTVSGAWPNQTVTSTAAGGGGLTAYAGTLTAAIGAVVDGACSTDQAITVTSAATGDQVYASLPSTFPAGVLATAFVSAANTVSLRVCNLSGASITLASATYGARVVK